MRTLLVTMLLASLALAGCVDDNEPDADLSPAGTPIVPGPTGPFTGFGPVTAAATERAGNGIWIHDGILYWTDAFDFATFDVSDPANPVQLAHMTEESVGEPFRARDVDFLAMGDRNYVAVAGGGIGIHLVDVTDPAAPVLVSTASMGVHNLAVVPGTPYVYSATASGTQVNVADFTDPANPVIHSFPVPQTMGGIPVTSNGCHDIWVREDLGRAYCAGGGSQYITGGGETFIWDISEDPLNPVWISMMDDPRIVYHHQAFTNHDGTLLIVDDEYVGLWPYTNIAAGNVIQPGANNCMDLNIDGLPEPIDDEDQVPFAAAWIWDISDEANPTLLSYVQNDFGWNGENLPDNPLRGNCGSHFGDLLPDQDAFVMGFYDGGTLFVDFTDPANPEVIDRLDAVGGETWDARYWNGHVFHASGDLLVTPLLTSE